MAHLTEIGSVLKRLREKHSLSMKAAAKLIGVSDSWISQIENGRAEAPAGPRLDAFLKIYGGIGQKYFYELVRDWKAEISDLDLLVELLPKLKKEQILILKNLAEQFARGPKDS